jgi:hypothetical protein
VTKRHYRGRCTACFKGVLKHRPRSGVGAIMSRAGAWVSRAGACRGGRAASVRAQADTAPGQGQAVTQQGIGHGQGGPHWWHLSGQDSTQPLAKATGNRTGKAPGLQGQAGNRSRIKAPGTGRHRTRSRASGHASGHRAAQVASIRAGGTKHPAPSRWRCPSGTAQARPAPGTGLQGQTGPHGQPGTGRHRTRSKASGQTARHRHRAASGKAGRSQHPAPAPAPAAGAGHQAPHRQGQHRAPACKGKPGRTAPGQGQTAKPQATGHRPPAGRRGTGHRQGRPHGWHRSGRGGTRQSAPQALARVIVHRAGHGQAGRHARHRARVSRAAQVASIRAGRTQPLALAIGHRKGKASTCKASGRTGQAGTGRHRTRSWASGYASRHRAPHRTGQGQRQQAGTARHRAPHVQGPHLQDTGQGQAGPVSPQNPAPQPLALSSGTGPGMGRRATPGQRQAAKLQGIGHQRQQVGTASIGHRACKVRRAASIWSRASRAARVQASTCKARGRTGTDRHRTRASGYAARHRARASRAALVASIRAGQHSAAGESHQTPHGLHGCHPLRFCKG